jgi:hypothetical protein
MTGATDRLHVSLGIGSAHNFVVWEEAPSERLKIRYLNSGDGLPRAGTPAPRAGADPDARTWTAWPVLDGPSQARIPRQIGHRIIGGNRA